MIYAQPGVAGAVVSFKNRYENYIDGQWTAPVKGEYFTNYTPVTGAVICEIPRSSSEDIELAFLDELLSSLSGSCSFRRLQKIRYRQGKP